MALKGLVKFATKHSIYKCKPVICYDKKQSITSKFGGLMTIVTIALLIFNITRETRSSINRENYLLT